MTERLNISVDTMGGDFAPLEIVCGAMAAAIENPSATFHLFGDEAQIRAIIRENGGSEQGLVIHPTTQCVGMDESPVSALKNKPDSSLARSVEFVRDGHADAVFGAGNTGATVAAAQLAFRRIKGVQKAGIMTYMPSIKDPSLVIDVGANIYPKKEHLVQYAVMASLYAEDVLGRSNPKVGLLNIGEEEEKGHDLAKETFTLLKQAGLNFIGNVEGNELFKGVVDVVVTDGFTGNVLLKTAEGAGEMIHHLLKQAAAKEGSPPVADKIIGSALKCISYQNFGGAPLLGLEKMMIIGHGRSSRVAVKNGLKNAIAFGKKNFTEKIVARIAALSPLLG